MSPKQLSLSTSPMWVTAHAADALPYTLLDRLVTGEPSPGRGPRERSFEANQETVTTITREVYT